MLSYPLMYIVLVIIIWISLYLLLTSITIKLVVYETIHNKYIVGNIMHLMHSKG
jgi:NADH:ubiquinone oxidoreductase subunit K